MECFVVDGGVRAEVVMGQFSELFSRVERDLQQWVKAVIESSLGSLGTVGAIAVEEFLSKLKSAVQDLGQSSSVPCESDGLPRPASLAGSVAEGNSRGIGVNYDVHSEFGERSVIPSGVASFGVSSTSKPGNQSQKIMWRGFTDNLRKFIYDTKYKQRSFFEGFKVSTVLQ